LDGVSQKDSRAVGGVVGRPSRRFRSKRFSGGCGADFAKDTSSAGRYQIPAATANSGGSASHHRYGANFRCTRCCRWPVRPRPAPAAKGLEVLPQVKNPTDLPTNPWAASEERPAKSSSRRALNCPRRRTASNDVHRPRVAGAAVEAPYPRRHRGSGALAARHRPGPGHAVGGLGRTPSYFDLKKSAR